MFYIKLKLIKIIEKNNRHFLFEKSGLQDSLVVLKRQFNFLINISFSMLKYETKVQRMTYFCLIIT